MCPLINLEVEGCFAAMPLCLIFTTHRSQILCILVLPNCTLPYPNVVIRFECTRAYPNGVTCCEPLRLFGYPILHTFNNVNYCG